MPVQPALQPRYTFGFAPACLRAYCADLALGQCVGYRADIDGFRAIAVLAILAYHYGFSGLPGGFVKRRVKLPTCDTILACRGTKGFSFRC
jgi:hypothetical protein